MASDIYPVATYEFEKSEAFLFDANIWIYLFVPQRARGWKSQVYSRALAQIGRAQGTIFVDVLVLSEFINRYARLEHHVRKDQGVAEKNFKRYRDSSAFKSVAEGIADASRRILKLCCRTESCFESVDISALLADYEAKRPDFNDQMLVEICRAKGLKLVTDDSDFKDSGLTVLTANNKLLG